MFVHKIFEIKFDRKTNCGNSISAKISLTRTVLNAGNHGGDIFKGQQKGQQEGYIKQQQIKSKNQARKHKQQLSRSGMQVERTDSQGGTS